MTAQTWPAWIDSYLAAERHRDLRVAEHELYPTVQQMEAERRLATPRRKKPAERTLTDALLDGLPTKGQ